MSSVSSSDMSKLKILAVEDNHQTMRLLQNMLAEIGIRQVYTAETGREAFDFLSKFEELVDVILCDWKLPEISGFQLLRYVRLAKQDIPFLMVTSTSDSKSVLLAKKNGVTGYLVKPFSKADLKKKIRLLQRVLEARGPASEATL
ncbi:MAG: response regulator [Gammaproteobacteria bacterium]|nr:response regulator [Gammaproteobacteria bacterium]MCZ6772658.1 response regulator [Pseudomonadota bacterium]